MTRTQYLTVHPLISGDERITLAIDWVTTGASCMLPAVSVQHARMLLQPTIVVERPPEGPARGKWEGAPWMIIALVVVALLGTSTYWLMQLRKPRNPQP